MQNIIDYVFATVLISGVSIVALAPINWAMFPLSNLCYN